MVANARLNKISVKGRHLVSHESEPLRNHCFYFWIQRSRNGSNFFKYLANIKAIFSKLNCVIFFFFWRILQTEFLLVFSHRDEKKFSCFRNDDIVKLLTYIIAQMWWRVVEHDFKRMQKRFWIVKLFGHYEVKLPPFVFSVFFPFRFQNAFQDGFFFE